MYNIYYSLSDADWQGYDVTSKATTTIKAFMDAVHIVRQVLSTKDVEFLCVGEMEFVIWAFGTCKGFLAVTELEQDGNG